ncbi:radical SAM protein [Marimonas lutisalis]|uniref:radical SAM protein n=1 Tax=Marimonas lutisalis TaxID=2545756 RepID=UPI0010F65CC4|nr:radical SAM protein [Marimonas lutisalis]
MKDNVASPNSGKFEDPFVTADGQARAQVALTRPETLWFNTGTLCNITCENCYIESSPRNDALAYLTINDVVAYLDQLEQRRWPVREIGFTGGEPFMNPEIIAIIECALQRGHEVLVLTNAMRPMMRPRVQDGLTRLNAAFPGKLTLRVSLDHHTAQQHDMERGDGAFSTTLIGMDWLRDTGIPMTVAGRTIWGETENAGRAGYHALFHDRGYNVDAWSPVETVLFPEMDLSAPVPEITTACWGILGKSPDDVMCASSRMVVRRKGAKSATVLACTLLAYDPQFELGETLEQAEKPVQLKHPHCAKFCVLGGASCSA